MKAWMCDEAYFASPDIRELARHFADYGYMFDDPGRVVVDEAGEVVSVGGKPPDRGEHPHEGDQDHGNQDHGNQDHGNQDHGGGQ